MKMSILGKVLDIYQKYYICPYCLGRMWALLGTNTTNIDRGNSLLLSLTLENHKIFLSSEKSNESEGLNSLKILAEKAQFIPAQKVLDNEGIEYSNPDTTILCFLCQNIFYNIEDFVEKAQALSRDIEFDSFLVGSSPESEIINREDIFKGEFNLLEAESFKSHFNRVVGKKVMTLLEKSPNFEEPDLVLIFSIKYNSFDIELIIKPLFISGRYNKFIRGIPQTHWFCTSCQGKGCELCDFKGKKYETSVEELISPEFIMESEASSSKFHGAGREDIDVKMLGSGRPFVLELKNPKKRISSIDLSEIQRKVNEINNGKVKISDLQFSNKSKVINIKTEAKNTHKIYKTLVGAEESFDVGVFKEKLTQLKAKIENKTISQRTPLRVSHRRADKIRVKKIYKIEGDYISPNLFGFTIETQGGTYIKELIHGDEGRTTPSFAEIFECILVCKELDVIEIIL
jgi:tRNA pseudouridine synthase 10